MPQVSVQPLLPQHRDECGQQRDKKTRVQESSGCDNLPGGALLDKWDSGGFVWDRGVVEGEEDCTKEGCGLVVGIGLKLRVNIDDESGTDSREQAGLRD